MGVSARGRPRAIVKAGILDHMSIDKSQVTTSLPRMTSCKKELNYVFKSVAVSPRYGKLKK